MGSCLSLQAQHRTASENSGQKLRPIMPRVPFKAARDSRARKRPPSPLGDQDGAGSDLGRGGSSKSCRLQQQLLELEFRAERLFARYEEARASATAAERSIRDDGVAALCRDLGLDPVDIRLLLFAWLCAAQEMCAFTLEEFRRGCRQLGGPEAVQQLRGALDARLLDMTSPGAAADGGERQEAAFKELYRWTFEFGLEPGQRTVLMPMALDLWGLVFQARPSGPPPILPAWLAWLRSGCHGVKGVTRDTWRMFLTFADTYAAAACASELDAYDQNEAWPSLIDEFVEQSATAAAAAAVSRPG